MVLETGSQSNVTPKSNNGVGSEDVSSPLYMHHSYNPSASLVPIPFDRIVYRSWKRGVL